MLAGASGQAGGGYEIERSVRLNAPDSAYLSRTPASAGNRKTWTWAGWVKRSVLTVRQAFFAGHTGGAGNYNTIEFLNDNLVFLYGGATGGPTTTAVFRDASAWMHVCVALDTTQATASNRVKIYVNGIQQTIATGTYPTQNADLQINAASQHDIGMDGGFDYFSGFLADIHFIDSQALTPSAFGEFDTNGVWQPIEYTGTFGTNGFHLPFSDNSTAAALGTDTSGNGNTWTVNNISVGPGGNTSQNWSATASIAGQAGYEATKAFDGDASSASSTYYFPGTNGTGTFTFAQSVPYSTIKIWYGRNNGRLFVNGVDMAIATTGYAEIDQAYLASKGVTSPLVSIGLERISPGNGAYLFGVQVNGSQLIDSIYNVGNDSLVDSPTNYGEDTGAGGEVRGNYCTWNPLDTASATLTNGNLDISTPSSGVGTTRGTLGVSSGKWYFEQTITSGATAVGVLRTSDSLSFIVGITSGGYSYYSEGSSYTKKINNNVQTNYGASFDPGDVIGVALDLDAGTLTFYKNGSSQGQAFSGLSGTFAPAVSDGTNIGNIVGSVNFGQRPFAYTAPSGFKALCTTNLAEPTIADGSTAMDVLLWTGDGSSPRTISGLSFSPDFVWTKDRSIGGWSHCLYDVQRGNAVLHSNLTNAETATHPYGYVSAFNSDGFTLTAGTSGNQQVNQNAATYAAWCWDAGSSTVTNTQGSITSQVRANASAGFSVVTYTGQSSGSATVGHGLGVAPALILVKTRSVAFQWDVYHQSIGKDAYLVLNSTAAQVTGATSVWNSTAPTSTVFSLGSAWTGVAPGATIVAYCFAPVSGYSSFGSYTGNGSSDGPFVHLGFLPRWIMIKNTVLGSSAWSIFDAVRDTYNVTGNLLMASSSSSELSFPEFDLLSNGFKIRGSNNTWNEATQTHIYMAFAESPFQYSRAR